MENGSFLQKKNYSPWSRCYIDFNLQAFDGPTFSRSRLEFHTGTKFKSRNRNGNQDRIPLVVEMDITNEFGAVPYSQSTSSPYSQEDYSITIPQVASTMGNTHITHRGSGYESLSETNGHQLQNVNAFTNRDSTQSNGLSHSSHTNNTVQDISEFHCHQPKPEKDNLSRNQLIIVAILCAIFMIAEILGMTPKYFIIHKHTIYSINFYRS